MMSKLRWRAMYSFSVKCHHQDKNRYNQIPTPRDHSSLRISPWPIPLRGSLLPPVSDFRQIKTAGTYPVLRFSYKSFARTHVRSKSPVLPNLSAIGEISQVNETYPLIRQLGIKTLLVGRTANTMERTEAFGVSD